MFTKSTISSQPTAKASMYPVPTGELNALYLPFDETTKKRAWSYPLLDALSAPATFALSLFLPCVSYGRIVSRREHLDQQGAPHPSGGDGCGGDCVVYAACCAFTTPCVGPACLIMESRTQTRFRYMIGGAQAEDDVALPMCCAPCALTQESRELALEEASFGSKV